MGFDQLARERQAEAAAPPLGLAVGAEPVAVERARQLIEAHGGKLEMTSEKGAGTTATINLP